MIGIEQIKKEWFLKEIIDFLKDLVIIVVIVVIIRTFIAMPFQISGQSMYPSYYDKEFMIVDRLSYRFWQPKRWDVVVFKPHVSEEKEYFLKRVIWVPWDIVKIENGLVSVKPNGGNDFIVLNEGYLNEENKWYTFVWISKTEKIYDLWEWDYFVLWDNRNHSTDSRECFSNCAWRSGFITKSDIVWKVFLDLWYFNFKKFNFIQPNLWINTTPKFFSSPSKFDYWF
jgi:signal peptidase I